MRGYGHLITSMDEEIGVSHSNYDSFATLRFSKDTLKNTEIKDEINDIKHFIKKYLS